MKRDDPNRGVYTTACEFCGTTAPCRLTLHRNRYLWGCVDAATCAGRIVGAKS